MVVSEQSLLVPWPRLEAGFPYRLRPGRPSVDPHRLNATMAPTI
jgi:hypothetical protein